MFTWACSWSKRMPLIDGQFSDIADLTLRDWSAADLKEQEFDNILRLKEEGYYSPSLDGPYPEPDADGWVTFELHNDGSGRAS